ncbi:type II toxin-antitoxin system RelE/ParE family toxin [Candidatus Poriferisodalis sp.]|uniref:type II toxin-antitoxin system RelE/ParE family toxin n=1 Tax=Candidatus Poriferisodalis sp. TaxID=3101277 RepID=UPI003B018149
MIRSFRHRGLRALYDGRSPKGVNPDHIQKLTRVLAVLDHSTRAGDMDLPGFRVHALTGNLKGHYAVTVSGNWRVTFRFEDGHATDVNYVDYH